MKKLECNFKYVMRSEVFEIFIYLSFIFIYLTYVLKTKQRPDHNRYSSIIELALSYCELDKIASIIRFSIQSFRSSAAGKTKTDDLVMYTEKIKIMEKSENHLQ